MASIGRWTSVDPLADEYYEISSFAYGLNDPISKLDPNGMWVEDKDGFHTDNPDEIAALFDYVDSNVDDPPVKKGGVDWNQAGKDFVNGIPGVGPALSSGDKLVEKDYIGATADFALALADLATAGIGAKIVSFAANQIFKSAAKAVGRVFTQTAREGDLIFYSTKIGDDVIEFGGNFSKSSGTLTIKNFDIDGALTNKLGIRGIKDIVTEFGRQQGVKQVVIQGAKRTTGASPGKIPSELIFKID